MREISLCPSGRGGKTPGPEIPEVPGSNPGWSVIFRNKFFTVFSGEKGLTFRCLLASNIIKLINLINNVILLILIRFRSWVMTGKISARSLVEFEEIYKIT